jgi:hypothetical protein
MKIRNKKMPPDAATASWTAPVLWRFAGSELLVLRVKSGRGLPHSKTLRQSGCLLRAAMCAAFVALVTPSVSAALPAGWQHTQEFSVAAPGLMKISLPAETLDAARPALEDLRLCDDAGNEVPFLIEPPARASQALSNPNRFQVSLNANTTVITLETGCGQPLDGVTLESPAENFIKAVRVEGSDDGKSWQPLAQGQPIFRQPFGAGQLHISIPAGVWRWLRLTVDDHRSQPIPFTGAQIHSVSFTVPPGEIQTAAIAERDENPGETRFTLNLGAANLDVASVKIDTDEPLFSRAVSLAVPMISEGGTYEYVVGQGVIYRVAVEGQPATANLSVTLERQVRSRELVLLIKNGDSPPLAVTAVRVERRPVYLVFMARQSGTFHLLTGNKTCAAPRYDLAALGADLKSAAVTPMKISALANNPDFRAPEALAGLEVTGAALDVSGWKYRKPVQPARAGGQQVELDLDVLSHADGSLADLRVLSGSNQVPFIVQRTSISRAITPVVTATNDAKNPKLSRWLIRLPKYHLPLTRLTCATTTPLFQRTMSLSMEYTDDRGDTFRRQLGNATWTQTPERKSKEFSLSLDSVAENSTLILETDNGDNPPVALEKFTAFYPATRLLFKAKADDRLFLYYDNPQVPPPSYDLSLVAGELLAADKAAAALGTEEQLKKSSWAEGQTPGTGGIIYWGILAVVVIGLLVIISRLLPKSPPPAQ